MLAFPLRWRSRWLVIGLLLAVVSMLAVAPGTAPASPKAKAAKAHAAVVRLKHASKAQRAADHRLVVKARRLKRCQRRHAGACKAQRRAVQSAGVRLTARSAASTASPAVRRTGRVPARRSARRRSASTARSCVGIPSATSTAMCSLRMVPGQADQYSVVKGTSTTPPAVPGQTVRYSVRADAAGSAWSNEVSIAYAAVEPASSQPEPAPAPSVDLLAAPALTASGTSLAWNQVGSVTTYVLVRKVDGMADQYTVVSGTTTTPTPVAGKTARYSVRTAIDGSAWSTEVSIAYPAEPAPARRRPGARAGRRQLPDGPRRRLGRHLRAAVPAADGRENRAPRVRTSAPPPRPSPRRWTRTRGRGSARSCSRPSTAATPTSAEALSLASWAAAYGPGGTFWAGKSYPAGTARDAHRVRQRDELQLPVRRQLAVDLCRARTDVRAARQGGCDRDPRRERERRPARDRRQRRQPERLGREHVQGRARPRRLRLRLDDPSVRPELVDADRLDDQLDADRRLRATCRSGSPSGASRPTTAAACQTTTASTSA